MKSSKCILSLDPMYSSLHARIAGLYSGHKYALLSSLAMKVYLKSFKCILINRRLKSVIPDSRDFDILNQIDNHYTASIRHYENRTLNSEESEYMARFSALFRHFLLDKKVDLVLIHNDLRWYHSIAIKVCQEMGVDYLITEQGLFRPYTTVIDNLGVNAYSSLAKIDEFPESSRNVKVSPNTMRNHNSNWSKLYFFIFLLVYNIEKPFGSTLKYQHNKYSLFSYIRRFISQYKNGAYNNKEVSSNLSGTVNIFVPMQLENDTQILIHSEFSSNQELINQIEESVYGCAINNVRVIFKKHPNDVKNYTIDDKSLFVSGSIQEISESSCLAITVNSSAAIDILRTNVPLFLLGSSIYSKSGVAVEVRVQDLQKYVKQVLLGKDQFFSKDKRNLFLKFLLEEYSVIGAGFSYDDEELIRVLSRYNLY